MAKNSKHSLPLPIVGKLYQQVVKAVTPEKKEREKPKDIILYVGKVYNHMIDAIKAHTKEEKKKYRIALLHDSKQKLDKYTVSALDRVDIVLSCNTNSPDDLQKTLMPYAEALYAVTCRTEGHIPLLSKVIPHVPYVLGPTAESLLWSSEKLKMRRRLYNYDEKLTPAFTIIHDQKKESIKRIEKDIKYPMVVKPSGLAESMFVTICYHREELESTLKTIFKKMEQRYKDSNFLHDPQILVEHFMEGNQYSIDAYVNNSGKIFFCPLVYVKTGKSIGFDDFFGYIQMTPSQLNDDSQAAAKETATKTIYALGLRNTSVHIELFRTEDGWKVIEAGARVGGFRHMLYSFSFGINHTVNDILNKAGKKPIIPKKQLGHSVAMKFYAKKEGRLAKISGIKKIQDLKSFKRIYINKKIGDVCKFAKHGGVSIFNIIMFNKERSDLLADIRRAEQMIDIETE